MPTKISKPLLALQFLTAIPVMMVIVFWPAGTLRWIEGWVYIILQLGYALLLTFYFLKHDPGMIQKRMQMKVPPKLWDRMVMLPFISAMIALLIVPGFDVIRYSWSSLPVYIELIGFFGFILASYWIFLVMKENSYLLKTVEIQKDQKVVSTGPYAIVRHPMYSSIIVMVFSIALALGSLYSLIPAGIATIFLLIRTHFEDMMLQNELKGYKEYTRKTRYRIVPGIW